MIGKIACRHAGLICVLVLACALTSSAADWPQWRGPNGDGISLDTGLLKEWPEGGPEVVWEIDNLGEGYSCISVVDGRIYTQGNVNDVETVIALNEADGSLIWAVAPEAIGGQGFHNDQGNGPRSQPTFDEGRLFVEGANGDVTCLDPETGGTTWHVNLINDFGGQRPNWLYSESPVVAGDMVIVTPGGQGGTVVALNKGSGEVIWRSDEVTDVAEYSSPVLAEVGGIPQVVQFAKNGAYGLSLDAGRLLWHYRHQKANNSINITTPVVANDHVLIASAYGNGAGGAKITTTDGTQSAEEVYFVRELDNHHGGIIKVGDYAYGTGSRGLICMNFLTGEIAWMDQCVGKGSLTVADGMIYMLGERHEMALVEAMPDGYREHGRFGVENLGRPSWAHPVVANGRLYIRNQHKLTAYDVRANG